VKNDFAKAWRGMVLLRHAITHFILRVSLPLPVAEMGPAPPKLPSQIMISYALSLAEGVGANQRS
jgi:hypothetical protein